MAKPLSRSEMNAWTQAGLSQQANRNTQYRYGEPTSPPTQQQQPQGGGGRMLGDLFSGNGLMAAGHAGFGNAVQGAMGQMWDINKRNQDAALATQAMGGGGGGQANQSPGDRQIPWKTLPSQAFGQQLRDQNQQRQNDFNWQQKMRQQQLMNANQWRANGYQYPGVSGGPLGAAFTTNYGAYGSVSNPTMGGGMF